MVRRDDVLLDEHALATLPVDDLERERRQPRNNAATGASAAGIRAISAQFIAFYFRAPIKAFFRTRVDYMAYARAINPRVQANEKWSWKMTTPGILAHAVKQYGWDFIPKQVLPPMLANVTVGAVLYTSYLQALGAFYDPTVHTKKRVYPPPPMTATFSAGFTAGALQSLVAAPLDALQVRFNTSDMLESKYTSMWHYARNKLHEIGLRGVFAGWGLSFVKDSIGYGIFFCTFETIKSQAYYDFVAWYYANARAPGPALTEPTSPAIPQPLDPHAPPHETSTVVTVPPHPRPPAQTIRPHYALPPAFLLAAGVAASLAQQLVIHPLSNIQAVHYNRLESLDFAARLQPRAAQMLLAYYAAYGETYAQCAQLARRAGGWRQWLFRGLVGATVRQVPSTSAGLVVFELVRRRFADDDSDTGGEDGEGEKEVGLRIKSKDGSGGDVLLLS